MMNNLILTNSLEVSGAAYEYTAKCFQHVLNVVEDNDLLDRAAIIFLLKEAVKLHTERSLIDKTTALINP